MRKRAVYVILLLLIISIFTISMYVLYIEYGIKNPMNFINISIMGILLLAALIRFLIIPRMSMEKRTPVVRVGILKSKPITIKFDGSIIPKDAPISREGDVYVFLGDVEIPSGHGIFIEKDNVIIDGRNHLLRGRIGKRKAGNYGIYLKSRKGIKIMNLRIQGFHTGIYLQESSNNEIVGNLIENNDRFGIFLDSSNNNEIVSNKIKKNPEGIFVRQSSNNKIIDNDIENSELNGIVLCKSSSDNEIIKSRFINCGLEVWDAHNNIISDNFVNGKPLLYFENESDKTIKDINAGQVILVKCRNMAVENLNLSDTTLGVELCETKNSIIRNNRLVNNKYGIFLWNSSENEIVGNSIEDNRIGIFATGNSSDNRILLNDFINNGKQVNIPPVTNFWDDGSKGNFWSDYKSADSDKDGIGDIPYVIDKKNADHYPLIKPYRGFLKTLMRPYETPLEEISLKPELQVETPNLFFVNEWNSLLLKIPKSGRIGIQGEVEWFDPGVVQGEVMLPVKPLRAGSILITITVHTDSEELKKTVWLNVVPPKDVYLPPPPFSS